MTGIDRERLGPFLGALVALGVLYVAVARASGLGVIALLPIYMFTPAAAALFVWRRTDLPRSALALSGDRPLWVGLAAILGLALVCLALALALAVPGIAFVPDADPLPGIPLPPGALGLAVVFGLILALGSTVNAALAFGEELGWRGYLLWELAPLGFWRASVAVGTLWGLWHAPAIVAGYNFPTFPLAGVAVMTGATIAFSPVYTYVVVRSGSVVAAALLHGVFNSSAGLVLVYTAADDPVLTELVASPVGAAGAVAFAVPAAVLALRGAPTLSRARLGDGERGSGEDRHTDRDDARPGAGGTTATDRSPARDSTARDGPSGRDER